MKITDVTLSILKTELAETVIPTHGAVDAMPQLVLVSVSTAEGIDGNYGERPSSGFAFRQVPKVPKTSQHSSCRCSARHHPTRHTVGKNIDTRVGLPNDPTMWAEHELRRVVGVILA